MTLITIVEKEIPICNFIKCKKGVYEICWETPKKQGCFRQTCPVEFTLCDDVCFRNPGNYTFEIKIYSCSEINNTLSIYQYGVDCYRKRSGVNRDELIRQYAIPIKNISKDIEVI